MDKSLNIKNIKICLFLGRNLFANNFFKYKYINIEEIFLIILLKI